MENKESTPTSQTNFEEADRRQLERIQQVLDDFNAAHSDYWRRFNLDIAEGLKRFQTALEKSESIGRYGWTIPYDATPGVITHIIESISDEASADSAFLKYFTAHDGYSLNALTDRTLANPDLQYWKPVLKEAVFCLRKKKYRACTSALLPVLEGLCARRFAISGSIRRQVLNMRQQATQSNSIERFAWLTFIGFTETVFHSSSFSGSPPLSQPSLGIAR